MNNAQSQNQQITLQELQQHFMEPQSASHDDFLEQMLSSLAPPPPPYDQDQENDNAAAFHHDQLSLASKFRSHHIAPKPPLLLNSHHHNHPLLDPSPFKSPGGSDNGLYNGNGFGAGSLPSPNSNNQFHHPPPTFGGGGSPAINQTPAPSGSSGGAQAVHTRPRVRARRGQATDPHSIAERLRRERIAERMKALQELVPNANKTDKASMLDEIIDYVKFLQLQVKVLSMSRLGGAATVSTPHVADISSEAGGDSVQTNGGAHKRSSSNGGNNNDMMTVTEHQVAKLMEEDMGSAMQYLQGKGLCLMPISLATAISTATCLSRNPSIANAIPDGPTSPNMSVLAVSDVKDAASVSKP